MIIGMKVFASVAPKRMRARVASITVLRSTERADSTVQDSAACVCPQRDMCYAGIVSSAVENSCALKCLRISLTDCTLEDVCTSFSDWFLRNMRHRSQYPRARIAIRMTPSLTTWFLVAYSTRS